jgi:hypothetical protein
VIKERINTFDQFFSDNQISEVILSHLGDIINEKPIYYVAQTKGVVCSLYDETVYKGYLDTIFNTRLRRKKSLLGRYKKLKIKIIYLLFFLT